MSKKYVYLFKEGNAGMRELLGGKGANLAEMTNIGLPVPQGFTITTEACTQYYEDGRTINDGIMAEIMEYVAKMEEINGKKFGDLKNPLLVSVRSGARASMPGMMDTILNLGLNDEVVEAMIAGNPDPKFERVVYDSYRRFIKMFSDVVFDADSAVDFSGFGGTLAEVENWDIEYDEDGRLVGAGAFNNDFAGDSLNLAGLTSALENDWVIFDNIGRFQNITEEGAGLAKINGAAAQLSDNLLEGEICGYDFSVGDNSFTLAFTEKTEEKAAQMVLRNAVLS